MAILNIKVRKSIIKFLILNGIIGKLISGAVSAMDTQAKMRVCGRQLPLVLKNLCEGMYNSYDDDAAANTNTRPSKPITEECCINSCSLDTLAMYCAKPERAIRLAQARNFPLFSKEPIYLESSETNVDDDRSLYIEKRSSTHNHHHSIRRCKRQCASVKTSRKRSRRCNCRHKKTLNSKESSYEMKKDLQHRLLRDLHKAELD